MTGKKGKQAMLCFSVQLSQDLLVSKLVFIFDFFFGGGVSDPIFFTNLLVRVILGYTPIFTFLSHLEGP